MAKKRFFFDILYCALHEVLFSHSIANCRELDFLPPIENKALKGHVIRTIAVTCEGVCMAECFSEERCVSYNLGPFKEGKHRCELSNSDNVLHPKHLEEKPGYLFRTAMVPY